MRLTLAVRSAPPIVMDIETLSGIIEMRIPQVFRVEYGTSSGRGVEGQVLFLRELLHEYHLRMIQRCLMMPCIPSNPT